jgi:hypothetical protein
MPDKRNHRGAHPEDESLFAPDQWPRLKAAAAELSWLLDRDYGLRSALALVGDRHALTQRQRLALARSVCSDAQMRERLQRQFALTTIRGGELWIDGYNLLITVESALAGAVILVGRDGCYRDLASQHGTYREVDETKKALVMIGEEFARWELTRVFWLFDKPVGNSGRLKALLLDLAKSRGWIWEAELEFSPDAVLARSPHPIATSDSAVLDRCSAWVNAAQLIIGKHAPNALFVRLFD